MKTVLVRSFILALFISFGFSDQSLATRTFNWNSNYISRGHMTREINTTPDINTFFYSPPRLPIYKAKYKARPLGNRKYQPLYYSQFTQKYSKKPWKRHQPCCTA